MSGTPPFTSLLSPGGRGHSLLRLPPPNPRSPRPWSASIRHIPQAFARRVERIGTGPLALHSRLGFVGALEKFIRLPLEEDRRNERTKFDGLVGAM